MKQTLALVGLCFVACQATPPPPPPPPPIAAEPSTVDLRPELDSLGIGPRAQGPRPTCSIFTACSALEFALARLDQHGERMSVEYLNWAADASCGEHGDGNFFHHALAGFVQEGLCSEAALPYAAAFDANKTPSAEVRAAAQALKARTLGKLAIHWIVPWTPGHFSLTPEQFDEVRHTLAHGFPVAAGSGHSRLLVGYRDDPKAPGGGVFLTCDSALAAYSEVSYDFVRKDVADVFWVEALGR